MAPTLPATRPQQVLPLAIDDIGQPRNVLLLLHYNNNNNNNNNSSNNIIIIIFVERKVFESRQ